LRFDRYKPDLSPKMFKETHQRSGSGILYDLGSHLLDQVISLFGKPKTMTKIQSRHRAHSQVDDYASLILNYEQGLNVFITASLLVAHPQKSFVLHGTSGSYIKDRCDVQERQLLEGLKPTDPLYGQEDPAMEGLLTIMEDGLREDVPVPSFKGDYMSLFDEVYKAIRLGEPYFVAEEQIITQLTILSGSK